MSRDFLTFQTHLAIRFRQMVREFLPETTYPPLEGFCESGLTHLLGELFAF